MRETWYREKIYLSGSASIHEDYNTLDYEVVMVFREQCFLPVCVAKPKIRGRYVGEVLKDERRNRFIYCLTDWEVGKLNGKR